MNVTFLDKSNMYEPIRLDIKLVQDEAIIRISMQGVFSSSIAISRQDTEKILNAIRSQSNLRLFDNKEPNNAYFFIDARAQWRLYLNIANRSSSCYISLDGQQTQTLVSELLKEFPYAP